MPGLADVATALGQYEGRYEFLDAFADDIDEIRERTIQPGLVEDGPHPRFAVTVGARPVFIRLYPENGIARLSLRPLPTGGNGEGAAGGAAVGALLGAALGAAAKTKEGLLGGLFLGMLVGGALGAAPAAPERVLALQFDPMMGGWRLYDGPLLRWAKRTLQPTG